MRSAKISDIVVPENRQRREFIADQLIELSQSIASKGLMHAIVLREKEGKLQLVAGERRYRAMGLLICEDKAIRCNGTVFPVGEVPYVLIDELDELGYEEAELEENVIRVDLTWQERAEATSRLHDLRIRQAVAANLEPHTMRKTVDEVAGIGSNSAHVRRDVILGAHLDKPEIKAAKNAQEAFKILKKTEERERQATVAAAVGKTFTVADHNLVNGNSKEVVSTMPNSLYDVILTDPPYGMGADEFGDAGGALAGNTHEYKDDYETWKSIMDWFCPESFRLAKDLAHAYVFCDFDRYHELKLRMELSGWTVHRTPILWYKPKAHRVPWPENGPRRQYETILYAMKGKKKINYIGSDVIECAADEALGHPAQKPVALYQELLKRSCVAGDTAIDFFAGTGPILTAGHELKVRVTAIEMAAHSYGIAVERLKRLK
jgi:DNA modification methylase/ParB-like chromosome segregation protein Spo0J